MEQNSERMSNALQENLLALLCFDDATCKTIRVAIGSPKLFESRIYREVAGVAIDYLDNYGQAIKEHISDELEHFIDGEDKLTARQYETLLKEMHSAVKSGSVNSAYVISQLQKFVRLQTMKSALIDSVQAAQEGDVDRIETLWTNALKAQATIFEGGVDISNVDAAMGFLDADEDPFLTGIKVLDDHKVGPARKTLFLVQAPLKRGKSWFLMHLGKLGLLQGLTVVHITLEMSERKTTLRYLQSLFGISKNEARVKVPQFRRDRDGYMSDVFYEEVKAHVLSDPDFHPKLASMIRRRARRWNLRIKGFPSGSLTMAGLEAYLDGLERHEKIIPDLIIIDYAELMKLEAKDKDRRHAIGQLFVDIRGMADRRNAAVATASQTNRAGITKRVSDETDLSEDVSKAFTVDTLVTYNQTPQEYELGLARLFVAAQRDGEGRQTALISQAYSMGQFCVDSVEVEPEYWDFLDRRSKRRRRDEEEDDDADR